MQIDDDQVLRHHLCKARGFRAREIIAHFVRISPFFWALKMTLFDPMAFHVFWHEALPTG